MYPTFTAAAVCIPFDCDAHLIPVCPRTKKPLIEGWQEKATTDFRILESWGARWPDAMLGVLTGPRSRLWALDIDYKNDGAESVAELEVKHGKLPSTARYKTPNGYRHVFNWPANATIKNRAGDIAPGIDVRGASHDGSHAGQVVIPPSVRADGGVYAWDGPEGLSHAVDAPPWLLFLAIFNKRERTALATIGITGPEGFHGVPLERWHAEYRSRLKPEKLSSTATKSITAQEARGLERYFKASVEKACKVLSEAQEGGRQTAIGAASLSIQGLLKGLAAEGVDTFELSEWAFERWREAKDSLGDGPHNAEDAHDRWERTFPDAHQRDLSQVRAGHSCDDFGPIDLPAAAPPDSKPAPKLITRWVDDQSLETGIDWLVEEVLPRKGTGFLVAKSGEGKTFLLVHLILCVARGVPFFGREIGAPGGSYLVAGEGSYSIPQRVRAALKQKFGEQGGAPLAYEASAPNLSSKAEFEAFLGRVRAADAVMQERYGVRNRIVGFDTYQKCELSRLSRRLFRLSQAASLAGSSRLA